MNYMSRKKEWKKDGTRKIQRENNSCKVETGKKHSLLQGFPVHSKRDGACSQAFQGLRRFWNYITVKLPHRVYTAVCVYNSIKKGYDSFVDDTLVEVARLSEGEIEDYLDKKEPYDKAGAYAIQGYFSRYIVGIEGDYYNVMGLPIGRLYREYLRNYI